LTASWSHNSEKPCTTDHAAKAAPAGSGLARRSDSVPTPPGEFGTGGGFGRDEGSAYSDLVKHHRVMARAVEANPT
jgi:hypothetical protein